LPRPECIAERLTHCDAACVGEAVAGPDHKILKGIVGMQPGGRQGLLGGRRGFLLSINVEIYGDQMTGYLLGGVGKRTLAVGSQELDCRLVRTADSERPAVKPGNLQLVEPFAGVGRVDHFCTIKYIGKNIFDFVNRHAILLYG